MSKILEFGLEDYQKIWHEMQTFTINRQASTQDEIWILEHFPVYTQGQAGKAEHILNRNAIPIVQTDRGGQVTYHGPGQIIVYFMLDCQKNHLGVRQLVSKIEDFCLKVLSHFEIKGEKKCKAPGVYVEEQKIASLGLRIKNHCSYHGLALNVDMDLKPFLDINPCGFQNMQMTQMIEYYPNLTVAMVRQIIKLELKNFFQSSPSDSLCNS
jgi:lipoyl(octanoyl) transferase